MSAALAYLEARAIDPDVAAAVGVRVEGESIAFPYRTLDGSRFVRVRELNGSRVKVRQPQGVPLTLWAPTPAGGRIAAMLCEGESDGLAALSAIPGAPCDTLGDLAVFALPGTGMPPERAVAELKAAGVQQVWLALDADDAGRAYRERLVPLLIAAGIKPFPVELPEGSDLADVLAPIPAAERGTWLANAVLDAEAADLAGTSEGRDRGGVRFVSAAELREHTPPEPPWILPGYLAPGNVTLLGGKPKAGKSTLALSCAAAAAGRMPAFLGKPLDGGPAVYVSEEGAATLAHKLPDSETLRILTREMAWPKPLWSELVEAAVSEAKRVGATLLVVDTLAYWAALPPEREKDSGAALQVMEACVYAAGCGLAVLVPVHTRKGGGDDGEGLRGSSAFAGAADIIVELERVPDAPRQRVLLGLSRYPSTPGTLLVELDHDGTWHVVSEETDRTDARTMAARQRNVADREAILAALAGGERLTRADLEDATGAPSRQWHATLDELRREQLVGRTGLGRKGDPYRFEMLRTDSAQDGAQNGAESTAREILFSAHPRRGAENRINLAASPDDAQCAEAARWRECAA